MCSHSENPNTPHPRVEDISKGKTASQRTSCQTTLPDASLLPSVKTFSITNPLWGHPSMRKYTPGRWGQVPIFSDFVNTELMFLQLTFAEE